MPAWPPWWRRSSSARAATILLRHSSRTTCRLRCWAPASCGSAGSASMPEAPLPRTASRRLPSHPPGALLTGVFAQKALNGVANGLLFGNPRQLGIQAVAVLASVAYSGVMTLVLLKVIGAVMPLRVDATDQATGLDLTQHGEEAYVHGESSMHGMA